MMRALPMLLAASCLALVAPAAPAPAQRVAAAPTTNVQINIGRGRLVTLDAPMTDLFVADDKVADVQVRSPTQLYIFGKAAGETTVYATSKSGAVVFSAEIQVGSNINSVDAMLRLAMPDAQVTVTTMNGLTLLTGTVATPDDIAEAERLVQAYLGEGTKIISRIKTATPLQVNLQVRIAEVSRSFAKNIGSNLLTRDAGNGITVGVGTGRTPGTISSVDTSKLPLLDASSRFGFPAGTLSLPYDPRIGDFVYPDTGTKFDWTKGAQNTTLALGAKLLGLDVLGAIDLGERIGQVTTLQNTNLTALSGETSNFLAGGEIPIPISQGYGAVSVEYKQYGVSLTYTPTVFSDGRISLRVRPEVSQLSAAGAVQINGTTIPALTTRRAETTVELGSGESFMIAGLLSNNHDNNIDKAPGLGDVPILGALFRSNSFQRNETELVIVITPYLVKPVNASEIVLPTDKYQAPNDFERVFMGQLSDTSDKAPPKPRMAPSSAQPSFGAGTPAAIQPRATPGSKPARSNKGKKSSKGTKAAALPGFSQ